MIDRVKAWFGPKRASGGSWSPTAGMELAVATAGAPAAVDLEAPVEAPGVPREADRAAVEALTTLARPGTSREASAPPRREAKPAAPADAAPAPAAAPAEPEWLARLEALPARIADSVAATKSGAKALERIAEGVADQNADARRTADAAEALPDFLKRQQTLAHETNRILTEQTHLTEALLDGVTGLRAAFQSVQETARRQTLCMEHLEANHRQVLGLYQTTLLRAYRRQGRLAAFAVLVGTAALVGTAYALYLAIGG